MREEIAAQHRDDMKSGLIEIEMGLREDKVKQRSSPKQPNTGLEDDSSSPLKTMSAALAISDGFLGRLNGHGLGGEEGSKTNAGSSLIEETSETVDERKDVKDRESVEKNHRNTEERHQRA